SPKFLNPKSCSRPNCRRNSICQSSRDMASGFCSRDTLGRLGSWGCCFCLALRCFRSKVLDRGVTGMFPVLRGELRPPKARPGNFLRTEGEKGLCLECADLGHLEFLPRGDTAVTRRATKYSKLRAVVVQWSRTRKRYERQGILAEAEAIRRAEEESLADADLR